MIKLWYKIIFIIKITFRVKLCNILSNLDCCHPSGERLKKKS